MLEAVAEFMLLAMPAAKEVFMRLGKICIALAILSGPPASA
jgi:hypothetical protein